MIKRYYVENNPIIPSPLAGISANLTPLIKRGARGDFNEDSECCGMLRVLKDRHVHCARV